LKETNALKTQLTKQELEIVNKIINDCELGTDTERTLNKVITRLKELIKDKPTNTPLGEDLVAIKEIDANSIRELLNNQELVNGFLTKIQSCNSYQELANLRHSSIKQEFTNNNQSLTTVQDQQRKERI
jgi:hypothetical protein